MFVCGMEYIFEGQKEGVSATVIASRFSRRVIYEPLSDGHKTNPTEAGGGQSVSIVIEDGICRTIAVHGTLIIPVMTQSFHGTL